MNGITYCIFYYKGILIFKYKNNLKLYKTDYNYSTINSDIIYPFLEIIEERKNMQEERVKENKLKNLEILSEYVSSYK